MSVNDVYRLPKSILIDMELMRKCPYSKPEDHMGLIKMRYKGEFIKLIDSYEPGDLDTITFKDIEEYIEIQEKPKEVLIPTTKIEFHKPGTEELIIDDNSILTDYRDRAKLLDYLKKQAVERIKAIKKYSGEIPFPQLEAVIAMYIKAAADIVDKEDKMKITLQQEGKTKKIIKERVDMILIIFVRVLKENITDENLKNKPAVKLLKKIFKELKEGFALWKIKQKTE